MKTVKTMLAGLAMLLVCVTTYTSAKPIAPKLTKDDVVALYISAVTQGKADALPAIMDDDFKFNTVRGDNVNTLDKNQFVEFLKGQTVDPSVTTTTTLIEEGDDASKIKVEFKYAAFVRTDIIDFTNGRNIKIINVTSTYQ